MFCGVSINILSVSVSRGNVYCQYYYVMESQCVIQSVEMHCLSRCAIDSVEIHCLSQCVMESEGVVSVSM